MCMCVCVCGVPQTKVAGEDKRKTTARTLNCCLGNSEDGALGIGKEETRLKNLTHHQAREASEECRQQH